MCVGGGGGGVEEDLGEAGASHQRLLPTLTARLTRLLLCRRKERNWKKYSGTMITHFMEDNFEYCVYIYVCVCVCGGWRKIWERLVQAISDSSQHRGTSYVASSLYEQRKWKKYSKTIIIITIMIIIIISITTTPLMPLTC